MINNLDEAIKHCEEKANENKAEATKIAREKKPFLEYARCKQCANDYEQLASWLKELKAYKERPQGDLISREALKKTFENACIYGLPMNELYGAILKIIDNAPTVFDRYDEGFRDGYAQCINDKEERKENNRLFRKGGAE